MRLSHCIRGAALLLLPLALAAGAGEILHVPSQYTTIQAAIAAASPGDTVLVADGTYSGPGNRDIDYLGKAITVRSENGPQNCIVDCQGSASNPHRGFRFSHHETSTAVLDGFTIQSGYAPNEGSPCYYSGGAVLCRDNANPTIRNCLIRANVTPDY